MEQDWLDNPSGRGKVRLWSCVGVVRVSYPGLVANRLRVMTYNKAPESCIATIFTTSRRDRMVQARARTRDTAHGERLGRVPDCDPSVASRAW